MAIDARLSLEAWQALPRTPVTTSDDPVQHFLLHAIEQKQLVEFAYHGGSECGRKRQVEPLELFRVEGCRAAYLTAFCLLRQANRTFRLDAMWIEQVEATRPVRTDPPRIPGLTLRRSRPADSFRHRWQTEFKMPFPLLHWGEVETFLRQHDRSLLWLLDEWDGPARIAIGVWASLPAAAFDGAAIAGLDLDEGLTAASAALDRFALQCGNCYIWFAAGAEQRRVVGCQRRSQLVAWLDELRGTKMAEATGERP